MMRKILVSVLLLAALYAPAFAANAIQVEFMMNGVHDRAGNLLAGGKVYTYEGGTNTPKSTYLDRAKATPAANPIVLDGEGKANVYADGVYKFVIQTQAGVAIRTMDNMSYADINSTTGFAAPVTITSTTEPQLELIRGAYDAEFKLSSAGLLTINTDIGALIKGPSTYPQLTLDNGTQTSEMKVDVSGTLDINTPLKIGSQVQLVSGGESSIISVDATDTLTLVAPVKIKNLAGTEDSTLTVIATDTLVASAAFHAVGNLTTAAGLTVGGIADISNGVKPPTSSSVFTAGTGWTKTGGGSNWVRIGVAATGGFVTMAGMYDAGAAATSTLGTINTVAYLPSATGYVATIKLLRTGTGATLNGLLNIATNGVVTISLWDGAVLAAGDRIYLDGVVYPLL